ncbi:MAG: prepilin-type N-terminal cleavage/methylation domain-containing protein [Candidatus Andersenbacteria bacterium]|nr:prepilin-type N-terminal cleavage/methylation domain-containing protein [Candidatus Andersenbacteria bacterium]
MSKPSFLISHFSFLSSGTASRRSAARSGMTLIEVVVSVAIIAVISALLLSALPLIRSQQQLRATVQYIQSNLRLAQQAALNETRAPGCLTRAGDDKERQRQCSDVGIAVRNGELVQYADTQNDNTFSETADFIISKEKLPNAVTVPAISWLFEATPPTIILWVNGRTQPSNEPADLVIQAASLKATIHVFAYGYTQATY